MKHTLTLMLLIVTTVATLAQKKKKEDIQAINNMCGCYEITFEYAETFAPDKDYQFHDNYRAGALEYVFPVEQSKDKIVLQHLLVIGDTMIIKHWRQDWLYENTDFYHYYKDNTWTYSKKTKEAVKGQWTQKVYQVDDSPRYEGSASWVHVDGRQYWENTTDAPLPRREFSKRSDYNVMVRGNRHEITNFGWIHEQDNDKVIRAKGAEDTLLAQEKGLNTYKKTDDSKCLVAQKWWDKNAQYWADVRIAWDALFASKTDITIAKKVNDKRLFQALFALEKELTKQKEYNAVVAQKKIKNTIQEFITSNQKLVTLK